MTPLGIASSSSSHDHCDKINQSPPACLVARNILADCVEFLRNVRFTGNDVDGTDLGPLVGRQRIFAQQLDANVPNDHGKACREDSDDRIHVQLDDHPSTCPSDAHQSHQDHGLSPVLHRKALLPVQSAKSKAKPI